MLAQSTTWRHRLRFAEALAAELSGLATAASGADARGRQSRPRARDVVSQTWRRPTAWELAAGLVLALGWPALYLQSRASKAEIARVRDSAERKVADVRRAEAETRMSERAFKFALYPTNRAGGEPEPVLVVPPGTAFVQFQILTEVPLPKGRYGVAVRRGNTVVASGALDVTGVPEAVPEIRIRAAQLTPGEYDVVVLAIDNPGPRPERAHYVIRVTWS